MATTSLVSEGLSLLNLENKTRQQPKIAHEQGAGSQCSVCGPKCSGFDLHYWRKICRNCRCGKENHLVTDEDEDLTSRVGRLLLADDSSSPPPPPPPQASTASGARNKRPDQLQVHPAVLAQVDGPASPLDWVPPTADSHLAVKYIEQLPVAQQPITGSQAAFDRKRALDRQLPSHDLEPDRCKSLSASEKRKMEEYVKNVKRHVVGQGLIQECPGPRTSGKLPPPPPQLDRILEQKVNHLSAQGPVNGNLMTVTAKPATVRPSSTSSIPNFIAPKPFVKVPIREEEPEIDPMDLPPPPPDMLAGLEGDNKQPDKESIRKPDPVRDFFDFLDEQEGKKLPGRLKSPFLQRPVDSGPTGKTFNASARPFTPSPNSSPNLNQKRSSGAPLDHQIAAAAAAAAAQRNSSPKTMNRNSAPTLPAPSAIPKQQQRPLLTTDFDALPEITNNNNQSSDSNSRYTPSTAPLLYPINDNNNRQQQQQEPRQPSPPAQQDQQLQPPLHPHYEQEVIQGEDQVWMCRKCVQPIEAGQVAIFAERAGSDKCWHPQCFTCSICHEMLADLIYFFVDESIFCGRHYAEKMNIPRCKACDELIFAPEYTSAEGASWHTNHFCCWICDTPLAGHKYTPVEGQPHCLDCYQKKYGKDCYECGKSIRADEMRVSHGEMNWHNRADCFKCACCKQSMIGRQFILKNQQIFCSRECVLSSSSSSSATASVIKN